MFDTLKEKAAVVVPATIAAAPLAAVPFALAEGETSTVQGAITGMATQVATDGQNMLTAILPVLAPLLAAGIVISLGIKYVSRISKK